MKQKKKNKIFTFICSFIPGAAEMYMGFMKMGISLLAVFILSFMIPYILWASDIFLAIAFLVWAFGFFHARNLDACDNETFMALQDRYIWEEFDVGSGFHISNKTVRKWLAVILIIAGSVVLWNSILSTVYDVLPVYIWSQAWQVIAFIQNVPKLAIAILIIAIGVWLIRGKKEAMDGERK